MLRSTVIILTSKNLSYSKGVQQGGFTKMTDYYIIQEIFDNRTLYQRVERRMAENHQEIADRCHAIIEKAQKQHIGKFFFTDDTGLRTMKLTHLKQES